jgi:2-C-methyl-D-erythritol 4-phosphate cytidylyltransferase
MGLFNQKETYPELDKLYVSVIIAAAGKGTRMNMDINKQYINIGGLPVLASTLLKFDRCRLVDEIILVVNEQDIIFCKNKIVDEYGIEKVKVITAGGNERQESVQRGLAELHRDTGIVLVHDGARPFVEEDIIIENIAAAFQYGAACTAVPVKDTVKVSDENGFVRETLDRSALWLIQTPQAFRYDIIADAYEKAMSEGYVGTDDAILAERAGYKVRLVMGSYSNIKITTREDLVIGEAIARMDMPY